MAQHSADCLARRLEFGFELIDVYHHSGSKVTGSTSGPGGSGSTGSSSGWYWTGRGAERSHGGAASRASRQGRDAIGDFVLPDPAAQVLGQSLVVAVVHMASPLG